MIDLTKADLQVSIAFQVKRYRIYDYNRSLRLLENSPYRPGA